MAKHFGQIVLQRIHHFTGWGAHTIIRVPDATSTVTLREVSRCVRLQCYGRATTVAREGGAAAAASFAIVSASFSCVHRYVA